MRQMNEEGKRMNELLTRIPLERVDENRLAAVYNELGINDRNPLNDEFNIATGNTVCLKTPKGYIELYQRNGCLYVEYSGNDFTEQDLIKTAFIDYCVLHETERGD